jgi:multidrug efflux pump subunit AcrA (membrane-fusion protein)
MLFAFAVSVVPTKAAADQDDATVAAPSRVKVKDGIVTLTLDAKTQRKGGIVSAPASTVRMRHQILGFGTVLDSEKITALHDTYRAAKARLQTAKANLAVSRAAYDRAKTLFMDSKEIPVSQLESKQGTFQVDRASLATAQSRVATVTANMYQLWGGVLGKALIDGTPLAADLIERRAYIVKVTLPPGAKITPAPKTVSATLDDGTEIPLSYISSATTTDPAIQGISYFYETPATDGVLPGLNVFASFKSPAVVKGVQVPASAVVWLQGKAWIYLRTGPETFTRREISPDRPSPHGGYVVTGLPGRANIVVVGAQMLLSEEFRAQTAIGDQD